MTIRVIKQKVLPEATTVTTYITQHEDDLIRRVLVAFGRVDATRCTRAFAGCTLKEAYDYVVGIQQTTI